MAIYTAVLNNDLSFNVRAQTIQQASRKVTCLLHDYPRLSDSFNFVVHSVLSDSFDKELPFVTMTSMDFFGRYKVNPNTNKKVIAKLLTQAKQWC